MKTAKIRFLEKGEAARLPKGGKLLPKAAQKKYIARCKPYRLTAEKDILTGILQTEAENSMTQVWRKNAVKLLERLKKEGTEIIIPPVEGELPRDILPFAEGRRLTNLFAFAGAAEALKRQGKNPAECRYLLVGGNEDTWRNALTSMGNEVNRLAIFTLDPGSTKELTQELFEERGLMTEVFSSPKNQMFRQADVVFCCGMEQRQALATSVAVTLPLSALSALIYWLRDGLPLPAALPFALGGALGGFLAGKLMGRLPEKLLRRIFALFLLYGALRAWL